MRNAWAAKLGSAKSTYFDRFTAQISSRIHLPKTARAVASAFFQLKLGHGYFGSYLHPLGHASSNKCLCGKKETPEHLILACSLYKDQRIRLTENLPFRPTIRALFQTKIGRESLLLFIAETGISTRKWRLKRAEYSDD